MPDRPPRAKNLLTTAVVLGLGIYGVSSLIGSYSPPHAIGAPNPPPVTVDVDAVQGRVLPFKIIAAIRNFGFKEGMVPAQISVSVEGGNPNDWMATAIYIAEHAIGNGAFYTQVEVYVPNPWGICRLKNIRNCLKFIMLPTQLIPPGVMKTLGQFL